MALSTRFPPWVARSSGVKTDDFGLTDRFNRCGLLSHDYGAIVAAVIETCWDRLTGYCTVESS